MPCALGWRAGRDRLEALLIVVALAVAGLVLVRGFGGGEGAAPSPAPGKLASRPGQIEIGPATPSLAAVVARPLPLHIFTGPPARVHQRALPAGAAGDQYALALTRDGGGRWVSVMQGPTVTVEGGALTVTLVVPWAELADRFTAVNLVVR